MPQLNPCEKMLHSILPKILAIENPFEAFENEVENTREAPAHTIQELRRKSTKITGDLFEVFCKKWLLVHPRFSIQKCYLLSEFPQRDAFGLGKADMGIDLIAETTKGNWIAIQCKYLRKPKPNPYQRYPRWTVPWKNLSTFYGLVTCTGPTGPNTWYSHWVMTNSKGIGRRKEIPQQKCKTIARGTFLSTPKSVWYDMMPKTVPKTDTSKTETQADMEEIRRKRMERFS